MKKPFRGWWVVSGTLLGNALQGGFVFWTMGIYTSTFEDEFHAPRAQINLIETFLAAGTNLLSPLVGVLSDRWSPRHLMALGVAALGLGLILLSFAGTLLHTWIVFATLIPIGALLIGVLPATAMISRWFRRRRGLAIGISLTGTSIGGAILPPVLTFLFMAHGWRTALLWSGVFCLLFVPVFLRLLVNQPADAGLEIEEDDPDPGHAVGSADLHDWTLKQIVRTSSFWWQTLISASMLAVTLGTLANLSLHAKDLGITGQPTALLYSIIAFCSFLGKISMGHLIDRIGVKRAGYITTTLLAMGMLMLFAFKNYPGMAAASVLIGMGFGGVTPIWTNMPSRTFGAKSVGRALGLMNPLTLPFTGASAPLAGYISDTIHSYDLVFLIYTGLCAVAAYGLYRLKMPKSLYAAVPHKNPS